MIVVKSLNSPGYTAFQPANHLRVGISHKTHQPSVVRHCGYIADAETEVEAIKSLYKLCPVDHQLMDALHKGVHK